MPFEQLTLQSHEGITRLTLNRPELRNAMSPEMGHEMSAAVSEINSAPGTRVVIVSGAGKAFSAGGNLKSLASETGVDSGAPGLGGGLKFYKLFLSVRQLEVPTIAAINGHAIGAGLCLALACDMRVIHERAKVGMTFTRLGIHPGMAATWTLPRLAGSARAAELLFTGRVIDAQEAYRMGLVNRIAGEDFDEVVDGLAAEVAAAAPLAVRSVKRSLADSERCDLEAALEREASAQAETFTTEDAREGLAAVLEKRDPRFTGR